MEPGEDGETTAAEREVRKALSELGPLEYVRLKKVALYWLRSLGSHASRFDWRDLFGEAVTRTLAGERKWNRKVDFVRHLSEVMRSIRSDWARRGPREVLAGNDLLPGSSSGELSNGVDETPDAERELAARDEAERIERLFEDDPNAAQVISGWRMEMKGPEIQEVSGMTKKQFDAAVRRIRRTLGREEAQDA